MSFHLHSPTDSRPDFRPAYIRPISHQPAVSSCRRGRYCGCRSCCFLFLRTAVPPRFPGLSSTRNLSRCRVRRPDWNRTLRGRHWKSSRCCRPGCFPRFPLILISSTDSHFVLYTFPACSSHTASSDTGVILPLSLARPQAYRRGIPRGRITPGILKVLSFLSGTGGS